MDDGFLALDVTPSLQAFLEDPSSNFGWVLIGDDDDAIFTSTAVLDIGIPPLDRLAPRLEYVLATVVDIDFNGDGAVDGADIDLLCTEVAASGASTGRRGPQRHGGICGFLGALCQLRRTGVVDAGRL